MGWPVSNYLVSGIAPEPMGDQNATAAPSGTFEAADGPLNIAANRQQQFEVLCALVQRPDLVSDPRFADREARKAHREELNHELNVALRARPAAEWERLLSGAGVPAARVLSVAQAVASEQLRDRGFFTDLPLRPGTPQALSADGRRALRVSGNGVLVDGEQLRPSTAPPALGENNADLPELLERWREARPVTPAIDAAR